MTRYEYNGPIDCDVDFDSSNLKGKTAVVTGGVNGIGEAYVRALHAAGVHVIVGDLDVEGGKNMEAELENVTVVKCNTTSWDDQVELFRTAEKHSPSGKIHYVVANAGVARKDEVFVYEGDGNEPTKPDLSIIDINVNGSLYTIKLAFHYFVKQNGQILSPDQEDTCLILIGSGAAFLDCLRGPQYEASKWAMRGVMHALRRTTFYYGSRVNVISPWYVRTKILTTEQFDQVASVGVELAKAEDAGQCLLRILSDSKINGRNFFISARKWAKRGYMDLDIDDYPGNELYQEIQFDQMRSEPVEVGLFVPNKKG